MIGILISEFGMWRLYRATQGTLRWDRTRVFSTPRLLESANLLTKSGKADKWSRGRPIDKAMVKIYAHARHPTGFPIRGVGSGQPACHAAGLCQSDPGGSGKARVSGVPRRGSPTCPHGRQGSPRGQSFTRSQGLSRSRYSEGRVWAISRARVVFPAWRGPSNATAGLL